MKKFTLAIGVALLFVVNTQAADTLAVIELNAGTFKSAAAISPVGRKGNRRGEDNGPVI